MKINIKLIKTTAKIIWFIIGALILLWTGYWFFIMHTVGDLGGVFVTAVLFGTGLYLFLIYIAITILFLIIKWLIKKRKKNV